MAYFEQYEVYMTSIGQLCLVYKTKNLCKKADDKATMKFKVRAKVNLS